MDTPALTVLPLASAEAPLTVFGGKGRSLAKLAVSGLPVPDGFLLSTTAYKDFVEANGLQETILQIVAHATPGQAASADAASASIQSLFEGARLPSEIAVSIAQAYAALGEGEPAVAVRSSATAEDLPDLSFAGQQDSYLNIRGQTALLEAIRCCWASLWTARAVGYREQMDIDQRAVAMGVIVQVMVQADVSGVLFTANPSSGDRSELVVNASFGLGEAVVGGDVTPDTYILDHSSLEIKETLIGAKERMIVSAGEQGTATQPVADSKRSELSLSKERLDELAALSVKVERLFDGLPQDIEWAIADGKCWLLQTRPITNLPAPPLRDVSWDPPTKGDQLIRRQVVENMIEPLSPLFDDLYLRVSLEQAIDQVMSDWGMQFVGEIFLERPMFLTVNGYAYCRGSCRFSWRLLLATPKILYVYIKVIPKLLRNMRGQWREESLPAYLNTIEQHRSADLITSSDDQLLSGVQALSAADAFYWFSVSIMVAGAKVTDGLLNRFLTSRFVPGDLTSGMFLRGFPSKTIEAQADLEAIARRIQKAETLRTLVQGTPAVYLLGALRQDPAGQDAAQEIEQYLARYGDQVYNLDFAEPSQIENPSAVLLSLKTLVSSEEFDTPARQAGLINERDSLIDETLATLGPVRRWLFRKFLRWAQSFGPNREEALFYMGAAWTTLRRLALELGRRLVAVGTLTSPDDVFYLEWAELEEACSTREAGGAHGDLKQRVKQRRELREARKRLHPPGIIPVGSRWKIGPFNMSVWETQKRNEDDAETLHGFAVSPGRVTGVATVIHSPTNFHEMKPDTILVCPTTTPAWTPLFAQARGLVTDIGGILAHGSIVAREYGIPAVLGTGNITRRIVSGQRITVDGDAGTVTALE